MREKDKEGLFTVFSSRDDLTEQLLLQGSISTGVKKTGRDVRSDPRSSLIPQTQACKRSRTDKLQ